MHRLSYLSLALIGAEPRGGARRPSYNGTALANFHLPVLLAGCCAPRLLLLCPLRRGGDQDSTHSRRSQRAEERSRERSARLRGRGPANGSQEGAVRGGRRRRCAAAASASREAPAGGSGTGSQKEQPRAAAAAVAEALPRHRPRRPLLETTVRAFCVSPPLSPSLPLAGLTWLEVLFTGLL